MGIHFNFFKKKGTEPSTEKKEAKLESKVESATNSGTQPGLKPEPLPKNETKSDKPQTSVTNKSATTPKKPFWKKFHKENRPISEALVQESQTEQKIPFYERFFKKSAKKEVSDKVTKQTRKVLLREQKKNKKIRRNAQYRKRMLNNLLMQAGFEMRHEHLSKIVFYLSLALTLATSLVTLGIAAVNGKNASDILLFNLGLWTALYAFVYLFIWMVIYVALDVRIYQRTKELEEVLPDFLQLASTNISAGMPIDRALWFAVRPNFGVLAKEIEQVAKETIAGEELNESLRKFTQRYDSAVLRRSINILLEGIAAGGEIADLLNKIALDIQETRILRKEMAASVATYAIFITFASIVMAPLLFALGTQLLNIIVSITSTLDIGSSSTSFFTLNITTDPKAVSNFKWFSVFMLSISAMMSASIVAVIRKGKVKDGIRNLPIFVLISLTLYFFASTVLGLMIGQLI